MKPLVEINLAGTWAMAARVYDLLAERVRLYDGLPPRIVVAPEIVYGPRTGALAQECYAREGVSANIWVSRSWAYSDELMSACMGIGSSEWQQAAVNKGSVVIADRMRASLDKQSARFGAVYDRVVSDIARLPARTTDFRQNITARVVGVVESWKKHSGKL